MNAKVGGASTAVANKIQVPNEMSSALELNPLSNSAIAEMETFNVELVKDQHGLGITIAGYVCEKGVWHCYFHAIIY